MAGKLLEEELTRSIIGAFYQVYNRLGFGFVERLYVRALEQELNSRGHSVVREVRVPVSYSGQHLGFQRLDMVVDRRVVVETKASFQLHEAHARQLFSYLRATDLEIGLLLNFGSRPRFKRLICDNGSRRFRTHEALSVSVDAFPYDPRR